MTRLPNEQEIGSVDPSAGGSIATISPGNYRGVFDNGEVGKAIGGVADTVADQALRIQDEMNKTHVQNAANKYNDKRSQLELERMKIKGEQAADSKFIEESLTKLDSIYQGVESGLKNSVQRKQLQNLYSKDRRIFGAGITKYSLEQYDSWKDEVSETTRAQRLNNVEVKWQNAAVVAESLNVTNDVIAADGKRKGWDQKTIELKQLQNEQEIYSTAIRAAIVHDDEASPEYLQTAESYLNAWGDKIPDEDYNKYKAKIDSVKDHRKMTKEADDFMKDNSQVKEKDIRAHAKKLYPVDTEKREDVVTMMLARKESYENSVAETNRQRKAFYYDQVYKIDAMIEGVDDEGNEVETLGKEQIKAQILPLFGEDKEYRETARQYIEKRFKADIDWLEYDAVQNEIDYMQRMGTPLSHEQIKEKAANTGRHRKTLLNRGKIARQQVATATQIKAKADLELLVKDNYFSKNNEKNSAIKRQIKEELLDFMLVNPEGDANQWLSDRKERFNKEKAVAKMDEWKTFNWNTWRLKDTPFQQYQARTDEDFAKMILKRKGIHDPSNELIADIIASEYFNDERLQLLEFIESGLK